MKVKILGCYGSETLKYKTTCFLFDEVFSIDAGALTSSLSVEKQSKIESILITHCHFDHIKDIPFLIDNIFGMKDKPVEIYGRRNVIENLRKHVFNDVLWPDFTKLPSEENPVMTYKSIGESNGFKIKNYKINLIPVNHTIETFGVKITTNNSSLIISSDTGPTEVLWKVANKSGNLKAMLVETSFPNSLQAVADASLHFTPSSLEKDLLKLKKDIPVYIYHLKPRFVKQIEKELKELKDPRIKILRQGLTLEL